MEGGARDQGGKDPPGPIHPSNQSLPVHQHQPSIPLTHSLCLCLSFFCPSTIPGFFLLLSLVRSAFSSAAVQASVPEGEAATCAAMETRDSFPHAPFPSLPSSHTPRTRSFRPQRSTFVHTFSHEVNLRILTGSRSLTMFDRRLEHGDAPGGLDAARGSASNTARPRPDPRLVSRFFYKT